MGAISPLIRCLATLRQFASNRGPSFFTRFHSTAGSFSLTVCQVNHTTTIHDKACHYLKFPGLPSAALFVPSTCKYPHFGATQHGDPRRCRREPLAKALVSCVLTLIQTSTGLTRIPQRNFSPSPFSERLRLQAPTILCPRQATLLPAAVWRYVLFAPHQDKTSCR